MHYANLAADRAKLACVAQTIVTTALAKDDSMLEKLKPIQNRIEDLEQAPVDTNNAQIGYVDD